MRDLKLRVLRTGSMLWPVGHLSSPALAQLTILPIAARDAETQRWFSFTGRLTADKVNIRVSPN